MPPNQIRSTLRAAAMLMMAKAAGQPQKDAAERLGDFAESATNDQLTALSEALKAI